MSRVAVEPERIRQLNDRPARAGRYVLYWMQQSQRASHNPALEHAIREADAAGLPVVVGFGLTESYPGATLRAYTFMLEGLAETAAALEERGIAFALRNGSPDAVALELSHDAALLVCDRGYLRHQRAWRRNVARACDCRVVQVESDVVVPVDVASNKLEHAARTLRPKIGRCLPHFVAPLAERAPRRPSQGIVEATSARAIRGAVAQLAVDRSVPAVKRLRGGTNEARRRLTRFIRQRLAGYDEQRSQPGSAHVSELSPYLHFGQLSPVEVALKVQRAASGSERDCQALLEQLVVRRELAVNFAEHSHHYDQYRCLPTWAKRTLAEHAADPREHRYSAAELEAAATHDPWWNAAMREMLHTGYMHNTLRMYWAKQILRWSGSPQQAFRITRDLNDKYFLDGRDPNGYANVAWCYGLHDRPWPTQPVFGKVRSMTARGLERKYDMPAYVRYVDGLVARELSDD